MCKHCRCKIKLYLLRTETDCDVKMLIRIPKKSKYVLYLKSLKACFTYNQLMENEIIFKSTTLYLILLTTNNFSPNF